MSIRIEATIHVHLHLPAQDADHWAATSHAFDQLVQNGAKIMATLDDVLAKVTEQDTQLDGVRALIVGLRQQVKDALANTNLSPENQGKVDAILAAAEKNSGEIADAIAENVEPPAEPTPTP